MFYEKATEFFVWFWKSLGDVTEGEPASILIGVLAILMGLVIFIMCGYEQRLFRRKASGKSLSPNDLDILADKLKKQNIVAEESNKEFLLLCESTRRYGIKSLLLCSAFGVFQLALHKYAFQIDAIALILFFVVLIGIGLFKFLKWIYIGVKQYF